MELLALDREHGGWEDVDVDGGRSARIRIIDAGRGWNAALTTRLSGLLQAPETRNYAQVAFAQAQLLLVDDLMFDLWIDGRGKVLSLATRDGVDELVGLQPGDWDRDFDLPAKPADAVPA